MRIDVVTIFPEFFAPLELSLIGRARSSRLLDVHVHDLRDWTHDRHRTVDDSPYGGGAGMVMKPEPWGEALDALTAPAQDLESDTVLIVPTPSGVPFTQAEAEDLARRPHLVFACGRYEGIDQRVLDHAAGRMEVREISLGDYVLNGGEVAAMAVIEAVVRTIPGFMGNPASLEEESHGTDGLVEYPVYTKPALWRGHAVPDVLRSGDHGRIATWRHDQALRRTAQRRPDLLHPSQVLTAEALAAGLPDAEVRPAQRSDLGELLTLQWACFDPDLRESPATLAEDVLGSSTFVLRAAGRLVGAVAGRLVADDTWQVNLLMVAPDLRGRGLGRMLLAHAEAAAPDTVTTYRLLTGADQDANLRLYRRAGYSRRGPLPDRPDVMVLTKPRRAQR